MIVLPRKVEKTVSTSSVTSKTGVSSSLGEIIITPEIDHLEETPEYQHGLWYSPYVKVYTMGGRLRIAEISNYPRAYKDTSPHVYEKDTPFTVTEDDLNYDDEEGHMFYRDSREKLYTIGDKATHWKGDSLPGAFPLWIESEELPFTPNVKEHVFPLDTVPATVYSLNEVSLKRVETYEKIKEAELIEINDKLETGKVTFPRKLEDGDKQIIRVKYWRVL